MLQSLSIGYIGKQYENGYTGYAANKNLFITISIEEGITPQEGEVLFQKFKQEFLSKQITSLNIFESVISTLIVQLNFPAHLNLAVGYLYNDILYVKTIGKGQIYFRRGKDFDLLMSGDKSASGYLQEYDMALLTTTKVTELFGQTHDIKAFVDLDAPEDIVEKLKNEEYDEEAKGFVGLFVEFSSDFQGRVPSESVSSSLATEPVAPAIVTPSQVVPQINPAEVPQEFKDATTPVSSSPQSDISPPPFVSPAVTSSPSQSVQPAIPQEQVNPLPANPPIDIHIPDTPASHPGFTPKRGIPLKGILDIIKSRKIAFIFVFILFAILLWSVVFGYQRRTAAELQKKIETTSQEIDKKLQEAEDDAFLNPDRSIALIDEANNDLASLKEDVGESKQSEIEKIQQKINESESRIVKREEKEFKEFYDLALEDKDAQGDGMYLENDQLAILDSTNSKVYLLDIEKKSLEQYTAQEVAAATDVALYNEEIFFINPSKGIYKFTAQNKARQVIEPDGDWGEIKDMEIYNGNIYLLDSEGDDIYKYLVAESGYSDKSSYFIGTKPSNLGNATDFVIDSAVYVAAGEEILKFLTGVPDTFETKYPNQTPSAKGVYTNAEIEQLYMWDTTGGVLYILAKDGEYNRQISSSIIRKAKDIFIYGDLVYVLDGKKLYSITLD